MNNWQEILWHWPSEEWWPGAVSVLSGAVALSGFITLIWKRPMDAVMVSRLLANMGAAMGAFIVLNSGAAQWAYVFVLLGMGWAHFLLATNWCNRPDPLRDLARDVGRIVGRVVDAIAPKDRRGPHDAVALHQEPGKGD